MLCRVKIRMFFVYAQMRDCESDHRKEKFLVACCIVEIQAGTVFPLADMDSDGVVVWFYY